MPTQSKKKNGQKLWLNLEPDDHEKQIFKKATATFAVENELSAADLARTTKQVKQIIPYIADELPKWAQVDVETYSSKTCKAYEFLYNTVGNLITSKKVLQDMIDGLNNQRQEDGSQ